MSDQQTLLVRPEQPAFYPIITAIHEAAFGKPAEAEIVTAVRQSPHFNPKYSLMALLDGQVVGHLLLSAVELAGKDDIPNLLAIGPVGVLPAYQGQLVGSALMYEALEVCRRSKIAAVFVLGDPRYYGRFGFGLAREHGFSTKFDPQGEHFMVQILQPDDLPSGDVIYHASFDDA